MPMEQNNREILRTYNNILDVPFKIYSIDRIKLVVPINPWDAVYYMLGLSIAVVIDFIFPGEIEFMWKCVVIPLFVRFVLAKIKLDGKRPHRFFWGMFLYFMNRGKKEFFKPVGKQALKNFKGEEVIFYRKVGGIDE